MTQLVKAETEAFPEGRLIAIGDLHGCLEELKELVEKLSPTHKDLVVFLGDFFDRGPGAEDLIQYIKFLSAATKVKAVLGNHDEKYIRYHNHVLKAQQTPTYKIPMRKPEVYDKLSEDTFAFLNSLPHAIFIPKENDEPYSICLVHAGLSPAVFNQEPAAFIRNRYFTKNVKTGRLMPVQSVKLKDKWYVPENSYPWSYYWDGRWTVVYGHAIHEYPEVVNNTISCDGGCYAGGVLRAWVKGKGYSFFVEVQSKTQFLVKVVSKFKPKEI